MKTSQKFQMLLAISALGCSQGPSWSAPGVDGGLDAFDAGAYERPVELDLPELQVELLMPSNGQSCAGVGDFVPLQALIAADGPHIRWSFQRNKDGCSPVPLGTQDATNLDQNGYATFMWGTSCALDIPDECGVGAGLIVVEVTDRAGETMTKDVGFCLESPLGADTGQAPRAGS